MFPNLQPLRMSLLYYTYKPMNQQKPKQAFFLSFKEHKKD